MEINRMYLFVHGDEKDQTAFIKDATEKGCFVQPVRFMVRQGHLNLMTNRAYLPNGEEIAQDDERLINGVRPYMTISTANPDEILHYYNWTSLEAALECGWKGQFTTN